MLSGVITARKIYSLESDVALILMVFSSEIGREATQSRNANLPCGFDFSLIFDGVAMCHLKCADILFLISMERWDGKEIENAFGIWGPRTAIVCKGSL